MKKISLNPYMGEVRVCRSLKELRRQYEKMTGDVYPYDDEDTSGRFIQMSSDGKEDVWLVWGADTAALAHEFSHVLLRLFAYIGHDPTVGDGEPFCYMISHLMRSAQ